MSGCKENLVLHVVINIIFEKSVPFLPASWEFSVLPAGWSLPFGDQVYLQGGYSPSWKTEGTPQPTWYSDVMFMQMRISINYRHFNSSLSCRNCLWYLFIKTKVWMYSFMYLYPESLPAGYMPNPQGSTWHEKVYLIAGKSPSQMEIMKVQIFQGTAHRVHLIIVKITIYLRLCATHYAWSHALLLWECL